MDSLFIAYYVNGEIILVGDGVYRLNGLQIEKLNDIVVEFDESFIQRNCITINSKKMFNI